MHEITDRSEYEEDIKKSRFHVIAVPVSSVLDAQQFFEEHSIPSASHNCWAYKIGQEYRFNDDGEPSGTAGKPILSAIEFADLTNVAVLVIRWFGGVKLGTGGLCRAYGGTAAKCLNLVDKVEIIEKVELSISVPFDQSSLLYRILEKDNFPKIKEEYSQNGLIILTEVPLTLSLNFQQNVLNSTNGKAVIKVSE